eukprot:gene2507-4877_t
MSSYNIQNIPYPVPINCACIDEVGLCEYLTKEGWPKGLQNSCAENLKKCPIRFMIVDDSGSMGTNDGHRIVVQGNTTRMIACSRWTELTESMKFHARLAHSAKAITEFRLLNGASPIIVGLPDDNSMGVMSALAAFESSPTGGTPLCRHIIEVTHQIKELESQLRSNGQRAVLVIATDGEASDGDILTAMRPLQRMPVWVVIRLCTDDSKIVQYWNNIDEELELDMDVLDDLKGEALEVYKNNSWLTYGEPLHQLREFGITIKELDLLDECRLTNEQIRVICCLLLGNGRIADFPHPDIDWQSFISLVEQECKLSPLVYSPVYNGKQPWVRLRELKTHLRPSTCSRCSIS